MLKKELELEVDEQNTELERLRAQLREVNNKNNTYVSTINNLNKELDFIRQSNRDSITAIDAFLSLHDVKDENELYNIIARNEQNGRTDDPAINESQRQLWHLKRILIAP